MNYDLKVLVYCKKSTHTKFTTWNIRYLFSVLEVCLGARNSWIIMIYVWRYAWGKKLGYMLYVWRYLGFFGGIYVCLEVFYVFGGMHGGQEIH